MPGQPDDRRAVDEPEDRRLPRFDAHPVHHDPRGPHRVDRPGHRVLRPDRASTADEHEVRGRAGRPQGPQEHFPIVGDDPVHLRDPSLLLHARRERVGIDVAHLAGAGAAIGRDDLVAGGEHRHAGAEVHFDVDDADAGEQPHILRPEARAPAQDGLPALHVLRPAEHVLAGCDPALRLNGRGAVGLDLLEHDDGVGPPRHHAPRGDPGRLARADREGRRRAHLHLADDRQGRGAPLGRVRGVRGAHRVPVHRGLVELGQVFRGDDIAGQDPAVGVAQRHPLGSPRPWGVDSGEAGVGFRRRDGGEKLGHVVP